MGGAKLLLLDLLPRVELLVGAQEYVLVAQLAHTHAGLGSYDGVDASDLVGNLPSALETPNIVVTECVTVITKPGANSLSTSNIL